MRARLDAPMSAAVDEVEHMLEPTQPLSLVHSVAFFESASVHDFMSDMVLKESCTPYSGSGFGF
tara:strand:+ start:295 stop:486 length:192 start_codon:yes stop_codon:yes gene_type:complete